MLTPKSLLVLALTTISTAAPLYLPIPENSTFSEALAHEKASLPHLTLTTLPTALEPSTTTTTTTTTEATPTPTFVIPQWDTTMESWFATHPDILSPLAFPHRFPHHHPRGPIADSLPQKTMDSLIQLSTRVTALTKTVQGFDSTPQGAYNIQTALDGLHAASLQTNDDAMLLPPLSEEDSTKIVEYIKENIVVGVMDSVKAMGEKEEDFKKAKLDKVVVVALKSLREDYDRPSMVLAKKIQKRDLGTARELLKSVDDAILEGIKGFEED